MKQDRTTIPSERIGTESKKPILLLWMAYTAFVVYGSLVPLEYHAIPFQDAFQILKKIPYLDLGMYSRADWIANIVLYVPVAYLGCMVCGGEKFFRVLFAAWIFALSCAIAVSVEFAQIYFRGRTVSLNDLIAEALGSLIGIALFLLFEKHIKNLGRNFFSDGRNALRAGLILYALFYFLYTLFPFDFIVSANEFFIKLKSGGYSPLWIGISGQPTFILALKMLAEILSAIPVGALLALNKSNELTRAKLFLIGIVFGGLIESVQLLLVSGTTEGASVLLKAVGFMLGARLVYGINPGIFSKLLALSRRVSFLAAAWIFYLSFLAGVNWVKRGSVLSFFEATERLESISFLPFYYHYYLPETQALFSALAYFAFYFPLGFLVSLSALARDRQFDLNTGLNCFLTGGGLAACFEAGKLFLSQARPDVTNILIGACGALCGSAAVFWIQKIWEVEIRKGIYDTT